MQVQGKYVLVIQNTVSIGLHNMIEKKQASMPAFLFMQVRHLVVVVSYLQEVVVPDLCTITDG